MRNTDSGDLILYLGSLIQKPTVNFLLLELESISHKWYELVLLLGVSTSELKKIQAQYHSSGPDRCMVEALGKWLESDINASWGQVVTAVGSSVVGDKHLADTIKLKYCSTS